MATSVSLLASRAISGSPVAGEGADETMKSRKAAVPIFLTPAPAKAGTILPRGEGFLYALERFLLGKFAGEEIFLHEVVIALCGGLEELSAILVHLSLHLCGDGAGSLLLVMGGGGGIGERY